MTALVELDYCVVDTETTGGRASINRVIDVAVFHFRDGIVLDKYQTLINPGRPIPPWITALTGIDDDMVRHAPRFEEIAGDLKNFLEKGTFVAHNAPFDYKFIYHEFLRVGEEWKRPHLCTLKLARRLFADLPSRSLGVLCDHLMIDIYDRHRAAGDAEATVYLLKHLLQKLAREHRVTTHDELETFYHSSLVKRPRSKATSITREKTQKPAAI